MTRDEAERERDRLIAGGIHAVVAEAGQPGDWDVARVRLPAHFASARPLIATVQPPPVPPQPDPVGEQFRRLRYW